MVWVESTYQFGKKSPRLCFLVVTQISRITLNLGQSSMNLADYFAPDVLLNYLVGISVLLYTYRILVDGFVSP